MTNPKSVFRVGDKVRVTSNQSVYYDQVGVITKTTIVAAPFKSRIYKVKFDDGGHGTYSATWIEPHKNGLEKILDEI